MGTPLPIVGEAASPGRIAAHAGLPLAYVAADGRSPVEPMTFRRLRIQERNGNLLRDGASHVHTWPRRPSTSMAVNAASAHLDSISLSLSCCGSSLRGAADFLARRPH